MSNDAAQLQGQSSVLTKGPTKKKEGKSTARYRENMPMREAEDETGQGNTQGTAQGAEVDPRDMSLQARQQLLDGQGGEKCICGRWADYARVDGGWAPFDMGTNGGRQGTTDART